MKQKSQLNVWAFIIRCHNYSWLTSAAVGAARAMGLHQTRNNTQQQSGQQHRNSNNIKKKNTAASLT